ncbi:MAG: PA0069 family radical SAM protein [Chitinophagaceae bacterium]
MNIKLNDVYIKGRGAQHNPDNRFHLQSYALDTPEAIDDWEKNKIQTQFFVEHPKKILNKVESPDIPMSFSLNPYQGCEHGCIYCYARNSHAYWSFGTGLDFESKIVIKKNASTLLRETYSSKSWKPTPISLSGNTDCYQPIERKLKITRSILELCLEFKNPVGIITKNSLILRDLDLIEALAKENLVSVYISITSLNEDLRRKLEPRTATYQERLHVIQKLSERGVYVGVMNAPIIPGINDHHMVEVLRKASLAGAKAAGYTLVRLNGDIAQLFKDWLQHTFPDRAQKVLHLISDTHGGQLNDSRYGTRMKGEGNIADILAQQFKMYCNLFHLNEEKFTYNTKLFFKAQKGQLRLF